jgi:hypothetical protein
LAPAWLLAALFNPKNFQENIMPMNLYEASFKPAQHGYVFRAPNRWVFGPAKALPR